MIRRSLDKKRDQLKNEKQIKDAHREIEDTFLKCLPITSDTKILARVVFRTIVGEV